MISLHCDLFIPDGLKNFFANRQNFPAVFNDLSIQCEFGLQLKKAQFFHAGQPIDIDHETSMDCGSSKLPADFELSAGREFGNFPVEFPIQHDTACPTASRASAWQNLKNMFHDGLKLLNEESLQFSLKFTVDFPSSSTSEIEYEKEESKAMVIQENEITELPQAYDNIPKLEYFQNEPELVKEVKRLLALSLPDSVELCGEGIGGTYFIKNEQGNRIAVFKPTDEEPGAENNPKSKIDDPLLPPGGGSIREVAAYVLDQGFAGVPETYLVSGIQHPTFSSVKSGSLQKYINNAEEADISSTRFSVEDVHKIGILDVRLYNMDRNEGNILIQNLSSPKLIPIDHSYVLPPELSFLWFEWLHWKQTKQPFSEEIISYIQSIDIQKDAETLRQLGFESAAIRTMMISSTLLKIAALKYGNNLFQIGSLMSRKSIKDQSPLERMVKKTEEQIENANDEESFMRALVKTIEEELTLSLKKTK